MSEESQNWLKSNINLASLLPIAVLVGGWVVFFATQRAELSEHDRRISILEVEIVPRAEHEASRKIQAEKDKMTDERLANIERMLQEILTRRGGSGSSSYDR